MAVDLAKGCAKAQGGGSLDFWGRNPMQGSLSMADRTKIDEKEAVLRTAVRQKVSNPSDRAGAQGFELHGSVPVRPAATVRQSG